MKQIAILFLISFFLNSCTKDTTIPNKYIGTWVWKESVGGITGGTITPQSTGNQIKLVISNDRIKEYKNETLISGFKYTIDVRESPADGFVDVFVYENNSKPDQYAHKYLKGLRLTDICSDCYQHNYELDM